MVYSQNFLRIILYLGDLQDTWVFNTTSLIWTFVNGNTTGEAISRYGPYGESLDIPPSGRSGSFYLYFNDSYIWLYGGAQLNVIYNFFGEMFTLNSTEIFYSESIPLIVTTGSDTTSDASNQGTNSSVGKKSNAGAIAAGIIVPLVVIAGGIVGFILWRRKQQKEEVPLSTVVTTSQNIERTPSLYGNLSDMRNKGLSGVTIQTKLGEGNFGKISKTV